MRDDLFKKIIKKDIKSHFKEMIVLIICESLLISVSFAGIVGYFAFMGNHKSDEFLQNDGVSRMFVTYGELFLLCGTVLVITVIIFYFGKRMQSYRMFIRMGITKADLKKIITREIGTSYLISLAAGFVLGLVLIFGLRFIVNKVVGISFTIGLGTLVAFPVIAVVLLIFYFVVYKVVKEFESDFLFISNSQDLSRVEKLKSRLTIPKLIAGIIMCAIPLFIFNRTHMREWALLLIVFFVGLYLILRNLVALILDSKQRRKTKGYIKNLAKNSRFYCKLNSTSRYMLFFSLIGFLSICVLGFQAITVKHAEPAKNLYPYDFVCLATDEDDEVMESFESKYGAKIIQYPMVRVANSDKTERFETIGEKPVQGQQIGISESTYHSLKTRLDPSYKPQKLSLDSHGHKIHIVHQQDSTTKAQPVDWYAGMKTPILHVGVPCIFYDFHNQNNTYEDKTVASEEIESLIGAYSTPKCENLIVFSDEYFEKAKDEWKTIDASTSYKVPFYKQIYPESEPTIIQGPSKLTLIKADARYLDEINDKLESLEESHMYIGRYDSSVKFHYDSRDAINDLQIERAVKLIISIYLMLTLQIMSFILLLSMRFIEKNEKDTREIFLYRMGMNQKERRKMNSKEWYLYFIIPLAIVALTTIIFFFEIVTARHFSKALILLCLKDQLALILIYLLINGAFFVIAGKLMGRKYKDDNL